MRKLAEPQNNSSVAGRIGLGASWQASGSSASSASWMHSSVSSESCGSSPFSWAWAAGANARSPPRASSALASNARVRTGNLLVSPR